VKFEQVLENDFLPLTIKLEGATTIQNCKKDHSQLGSLSDRGSSVSSDSDMFPVLHKVD